MLGEINQPWHSGRSDMEISLFFKVIVSSLVCITSTYLIIWIGKRVVLNKMQSENFVSF